MARNIQRGRDHGIPTYSTMRSACKLTKLTSFRSRPREISAANWEKLKDVYQSVFDIDLITGGLAETPVTGALLGKTFSCIIGKQFHALQAGDRYFFSHRRGPQHRGMEEPLAAEMRRRLGVKMTVSSTTPSNWRTSGETKSTNQRDPSWKLRSLRTYR